MGKRRQGRIVGLFVLLLCWTLAVLKPAAAAAITVTDGVDLTQSLVPAQTKMSAKSVAATTISQGKISGRLTDTVGTGIGGVEVTASPVNTLCANAPGSFGTATTATDGSYTISTLADGSYRLKFTPPEEEPYYFAQWYKGVLNETQATIVQVTDGVTTPDRVDMVLEPGGSISGTVSPSGALFGIHMTATGDKGGSGTALVDFEEGTFKITGLAPDSYKVSVMDEYVDAQYASQDYPVKVAVKASQNTTINPISLKPGGAITGRVTGDKGIPLALWVDVVVQPAGSAVSYRGNTDYVGGFRIGGLPGGTYNVTITDRVSGHIQDRRTGVAVTAPGESDLGIIQLRKGGQVTGTVKNAAGEYLANVFASVYNATGYFSGALTQANGTYSVKGLDGEFRILFSACQGGYVEQWYDNKPSRAGADPVTVAAPATVAGIDAVLDLPGAVTKGDVNGQGGVDVFDALLTLQNAVGLYQPTNVEAFTAAADVFPLENGTPKGNGAVDVFDALAILRHAVGLDQW